MGNEGKKRPDDEVALRWPQKSRKAMRNLLDKKMKELSRLLEDSEGIREEDVRAIMELVRDKFNQLVVANQEIYEAMLVADTSEEELQTEINQCDQYAQEFYRLKHLMNKQLAKEEIAFNRSTSSNSSNTNRKFKLPKIEFRTFSGEPKEWSAFWHQFKKIDEDSELDTADKMQYLIMATLPGSRARRLVDSYPPVGENYRKAMEALQNRYDRDDLQVEIYIRELIKNILTNANAERKIETSVLYDNLESNIRALETMGIGKNNCAAILFPMIESSLNLNLLRAWQRSNDFANGSAESLNGEDSTVPESLKQRIDSLLNFLRREVENEQRIAMAREGLGLAKSARSDKVSVPETRAPTASTLHKRVANGRCALCNGLHNTANCTDCNNLSIKEKKQKLLKHGLCYYCARKGYMARTCRVKVSCKTCGKGHLSVLCSRDEARDTDDNGGDIRQNQSLSNWSSPDVFLQTLKLEAYNGCKTKMIRVLLDSGAQRSYISTTAAKELGYERIRSEAMYHALFGGQVTKRQDHDCFKVYLRKGGYSCNFDVYSHATICASIPSIRSGPWIKELSDMGIKLSDVGKMAPIDLLIGADVLGRLMTGRIKVLKEGLTAVETLLGWTLMGKVPLSRDESTTAMTITNLAVNDTNICNLWELEVLGIEDPAQRLSKEEAEEAAKELFLRTVKQDDEGRYEVRLPWLLDHTYLPTNRALAERRLDSMLRGLRNKGKSRQYGEVFEEWLRLGIIEEVVDGQSALEHYLPHRPVIKTESSTTKVRPVFDASAKDGGHPSLNDCLEKGVNLIKRIPEVLLGFRVLRVGVSSDIEKAFLQIGINPRDRDVLRFLWESADGVRRIFRHKRVVFGINCSPFLLAATIEYHLQGKRAAYPQNLREQLRARFRLRTTVP